MPLNSGRCGPSSGCLCVLIRVTTKFFPASFCELGVDRFRRELDDLPSGVHECVIRSLRDRATEHGVEHVVPRELRHLL